VLAFVVLVAASSSSCKAKGSGPFVGSVSRSVVERAHCPVTVVHPVPQQHRKGERS
jgi:nucleotide-binding universal stress UspA family protein